MDFDYCLRDIPERLWQAVKIKVDREGWKSIRWVIVELLRRWVVGDIDLRDVQRVQKGGLKPKRK
jgi:hypothetical protein